MDVTTYLSSYQLKEKYQYSLREFFPQAGVTREVMEKAIAVDDPVMLAELAKHGGMPHIASDKLRGDTLLELAVTLGSFHVIPYLLQQGSPANRIGRSGMTPLMRACAQGNVACVASLLASQVDLEVKNEHDETALMMACIRGSAEIVGLLLLHGAQVDEQSKYGAPIHYAAAHGRVGVLPVLERAGANLDALDYKGCTPVMTAIAAGRSLFANQLLGRFVDVAACNSSGMDAIAMAVKSHNAEMVRALSLAGADFHVHYADGKNLRDYARGADEEFCATLVQHMDMHQKMAQEMEAIASPRRSVEIPIRIFKKPQTMKL